LLNRTLVIPSFVYARACEYNMYVISFTKHLLLFHCNVSSYAALSVRTMLPWSTGVMPWA
jgi:hypothetical protein